MLKIYLKSEDRTVCVKDEEALTTTDALYLFVGAIVALGFHPDSIKESICELAEDYEICDEEEGKIIYE
jgi:hypothetical protein